MATFSNNVVTHGLSGMLGDMIVFRQKNGKTFLSAKPTKSHHGPTEAQLNQQQKFQEAVLYAQSVINNPEKRETYADRAKDGASAFNVALADFLLAPHIQEIDVSAYNAQAGSTIRIRVVDDFQVAEVAVRIEDTEGALLENGMAVPQENKLDWIYTTNTSRESAQGQKIVIRASDVPGHLAESVQQV